MFPSLTEFGNRRKYTPTAFVVLPAVNVMFSRSLTGKALPADLAMEKSQAFDRVDQRGNQTHASGIKQTTQD
jgi:hypothetical protein